MTENQIIKKTNIRKIPSALLSNRGKIRENNEDRLAVCNFISTEKPARDILLAVLSDGVGGHQAGEVAAQLGVDMMVEAVNSLHSLVDPGRTLADAVLVANLAVLEKGKDNPHLDGMGATLMAALIIHRTLYLAYLGDSRAYLLRGRSICLLNYEHTWLSEAAENGMSGFQDTSRNHPMAHVLSRYLGSAHPAPVDTRIRQCKPLIRKKQDNFEKLTLRKGDRLLLCSDGLTDMLTDDQIRATGKGKPLELSVEHLVQDALASGGHDNVSVILVEIP